MQEFSTLSVSSSDPAALATQLTERSAQGWNVVAIVPTGSDLTAFLAREGSILSVTSTATTAPIVAAEPAGWAVAPEPAVSVPVAAASPMIEPAPAPTAQPVATAAPAAPAQAIPPNWYADPSGRYEMRYWNGTAWTEHVSRAGQQFSDPPTA